MGKPDNEYVDNSLRLNVINNIFDVTSKPLIFDGDTGGKKEHFEMKIKSIERLGISAIIIEDKTGLKKILFIRTLLIKLKKMQIYLLKKYL